MSNVLPFPKTARKNQVVQPPESGCSGKGRFFRGFIKFLWVISVLVWPFVKWFVFLDLLIAFLKMLAHSKPASTWHFMAHVLAAVLIFWFARLYKPKGM